MRYPPEHKQRTRQRILDEAATLFRRHGYRGVGIDRIMAAAGLTRGGFYAHFSSKQELFAEVLDRESDFVRRLRAARGPDAEGACAVIAGYLDPKNKSKVGRGCTLASLTGEVPRAGKPAHRAYASSVERLAAELELRMPDGRADRRERALQAAALCVGAITIARGAGSEAVGTEMLAACRTQAVALVRGE